MSNLFWIDAEKWKRIAPELPQDVRGAKIVAGMGAVGVHERSL